MKCPLDGTEYDRTSGVRRTDSRGEWIVCPKCFVDIRTATAIKTAKPPKIKFVETEKGKGG